ncbi:ATP-dependent DNA helicase RecG [Collinsella tanakaei]|nr:ATP-dependent DNA helicase RecG [Collinsella tanakaei]
MASGITAPVESSRMARVAALEQDVSRLKYVSGAREEALRRLGIESVGDLLSHIPRRYLDFSHAYTIESAPLGQVCTIVATVDRVVEKRPRPRMTVTEVYLVDATSVLQVAFFKQPWLSRDLKAGDRLAVMGKVEFAYGFKQMSSPHYEKLDAQSASGTIVPVHAVGEGVSQAWMRRIVSTALEEVADIPDPLPARLRTRRGLMSLSRALRSIHFPSSMGERDLARKRLAYDEVLLLQLALRLRNDANLLDIEPIAHRVGEHVARVRAELPFALTDEQATAVDEILADMARADRVMNRLLLGDVGTGKTAVAMVVLAAVADTGTQACVMAPTGVLAQQYAVKCAPVLERAGVRSALLTGATPAGERAKIVDGVRCGSIDVLFGTHAVLSVDVAFRRLSLVVIDEQHRFGVGQRNALRAKGPGADLLVMTATPIPRTLALSVYGDLETSIIRKRPVAGAGVATKVLDDANRDIAYGAVREALGAGQQAYVICPLVAERDGTDDLEDVPGLEVDDEGKPRSQAPLHAVETEVEHLRHVFCDATVDMLHGRMGAREKDDVIDRFRSGQIQVLVSTTVVEVGVDVPNATVMIIENGERFGLATLHQLRGRVGRGELAGRCFVIAQGAGRKRGVSPSMQRLEALEKTDDGFSLAEMDLRLRHEGEILGLRQHGGVTLRFIDLDADADLIECAHDDGVELLRFAPTLSAPATLPLRFSVVDRYGDVFKEVSGG